VLLKKIILCFFFFSVAMV